VAVVGALQRRVPGVISASTTLPAGEAAWLTRSTGDVAEAAERSLREQVR